MNNASILERIKAIQHLRSDCKAAILVAIEYVLTYPSGPFGEPQFEEAIKNLPAFLANVDSGLSTMSKVPR